MALPYQVPQVREATQCSVATVAIASRRGHPAGGRSVSHQRSSPPAMILSSCPRFWLNEYGQRAQTRPCPWPGCGREVPIRQYRYDTLRQIGWPLFRVARFVNWCGHGQELIPVPDDGEWARLKPVIGTAR